MTPCRRCGAMVQSGARFCSECGSWVVQGAASGPTAPPAVPAIVLSAARGQPGPPPIVLPELAPARVTVTPPLVQASNPLASTAFAEDPTTASGVRPGAMPPPVPVIAIMHGAEVIGETLPAAKPEPPRAPAVGATMIRTASGDAAVAARAALPPVPVRKDRTVVDDRPMTASLSAGRPPRPLRAFLISYQYEPLGTFWPLASGPNVIGRAGSGRADLDVGIADGTVSTEHVVVEIHPGGATVEDRGSRNGSFLNGAPLVPRAPMPLRHGDRLRLGSFETIVVLVPYAHGPPAGPIGV